jgi:spermidine/putrescine-binding protein
MKFLYQSLVKIAFLSTALSAFGTFASANQIVCNHIGKGFSFELPVQYRGQAQGNVSWLRIYNWEGNQENSALLKVTFEGSSNMSEAGVTLTAQNDTDSMSMVSKGQIGWGRFKVVVSGTWTVIDAVSKDSRIVKMDQLEFSCGD